MVDDDLRLASIVRKGLKEEGFSVDLSHNAKDGLKLALTKAYDVILLDLTLPGGKGLRLLRELRSRDSAVPIMIVTGLASVQDRIEGLNQGADDYLSKPFDFRELLARLRAIKRRPATQPRTVLRIADLTLDTVSRDVTRGGRRIELTGKEFALLEYLLRNSNIAVTRDMISEHVWDLDSQRKANLIEVYINYLRGKVDQQFEPKLIHTLRGTGYILREPDQDNEG
jgi:DNA-binding response OmpR family regulator